MGRLGIEAPGIYRMTAAEYHADPCATPSLSASMIRRMLHESPLHAWHSHPQLNPLWEPTRATDAMEEGTILHFLILGAGHAPVVVEADDWRTKAAQQLRAQARAQERPAVLLWRWHQLRRAAAAIRRECRATLDAPAGIGIGQAEAVLIWREPNGIMARCMIDWLPTGIAAGPVPLVDFKTTSKAATPEEFARNAGKMGYDIQEAWYRRGYRAVTGRDAGPLVFVSCEHAAPFGVSRLALGAEWNELGESKVETAVDMWEGCLSREDWPGYPRRIAFVDAPKFASMDWESRWARGKAQIADGSRKRADQARIASAQRMQAAMGGTPVR